MSKDPFEELFGPSDEEPKPVPARERLAYEQAERVKTAPLPTKSRARRPSKEKQPQQEQPPLQRTTAGGNGAASDPSPEAPTQALPPQSLPPQPFPSTAAAPLSGRPPTAAAATPPPSEPASATDPEKDPRIAKAKPWIVVGIVTVLALVASMIVLNLARADDDPPTAPVATETPAPSPEPTTTAPADGDDDAKKDKKDKKKDADKVPSVDVGNTGTMDVPVWGITAQISEKFGWPQYQITGEQLVLQYSPLIDSLPDSCAAMRQQWGIVRTADGKYQVLKPAERCEAAPELYDELWGLTDALVKSIKPL